MNLPFPFYAQIPNKFAWIFLIQRLGMSLGELLGKCLWF
jgi:hypothetical protein